MHLVVSKRQRERAESDVNERLRENERERKTDVELN